MAPAAFQGLIVFCQDVEAAAAFYEGLLGLRRERDEDDIELTVPVANGTGTITVLLHPGTGTPGRELGTFSVDDVDELVERARAAGRRVELEPVDEPWGVRHAAIADPDGHVVDLTSSPGG
jgi:catechol 2,3-dioxygenase-like lactoylglutathione lyase family enzyme